MFITNSSNLEYEETKEENSASLLKTSNEEEIIKCNEAIYKFTDEEISCQLYENTSLRYFYQKDDLLLIMKKMLIKLQSTFRNFTKKNMELRKVWSVLKNIWENHLAIEVKDPKIAVTIGETKTYMMYFIKELFESRIFSNWMYRRTLPDEWYTIDYFEKLGWINLNLKSINA